MPTGSDPQSIRALVSRAQLALELNQKELGELLGASQRTAQRWAAGKASLGTDQIKQLAVAVHPHDPELATRLASAALETLESLGLVRSAVHDTVPAGPPPLPPELVPYLIESVVCAAAEALAASPAVARGALAAALERAKATRLSVDDMLAGLGPPKRAKASGAGRV
jgi:hypothetical protein